MRTLISIVLGTIILFVWNAVSWMGLPFHTNTLKNIPEEVVQPTVMKEAMPKSGVYHFPGLPANNSAEALKAVEDKLAEGPRITLMVYKNRPTKLFDPSTYLGSLFINFLSTIFAFLLLSRISTKNFSSIFSTAILLGVVTALVSDISQMNWFLFPLDYTIVNAMDKIISFALLGVLFGLYTFRTAD